MNVEEHKQTFTLATGHKRAKRGAFTLRLTSMIDMFTILLVFLLKSYSAEGQIVTVSKDLKLPISTSEKLPEVTSVVSITNEWILLDGRPVEKIETILSQSDLLISALHNELIRLRAISESIGGMSDQMAGFKGKIAIQGDRDVTFDLMKRVLLTCAKVGYNNMHLTVMQKE
jgi:biopolymer transport protein ExbD